jgi:Zn-dependent M28 family amino/carboxypeptidase
LEILKLTAVILAILSLTQEAQRDEISISTPEEIKSEFVSVPCKNEDRLGAVKALFEKMGAKPEEITVEKFRNAENIVIRVPGSDESAEKIVIGAHYDKTAEGCGAVDNWTGIVVLAHIYRAMKTVPLKKSLLFVAFGNEEKGLLGSAAMVKEIKKEEVPNYCAMVNIDSLGLAPLHSAINMSSGKLIDMAGRIAKEMKIPFSYAQLPRADSDSTSFVRNKIPAISILGLGGGLGSGWQDILHTKNDQVNKINHEKVYQGYRLSLALLVRIEESSCKAFR